MIQITNTNNQLRIVDSGRIEFYTFEEITSVAWNRSAENGYYVLITFEAEYVLRIELPRIDNQPTWTNNLAGAQAAVIQISIWMNTAIANIAAILTDIEADTTSIDTNIDLLLTAFNAEDFATETTLLNVDNNIANIVGNTDGVLRSPNILRTSSLGNLSSVATEIYSVSVANIGVANGVVQGAALKPGEVLNFDASSLNHYFNSFAYDATGTEFIIIYIS